MSVEGVLNQECFLPRNTWDIENTSISDWMVLQRLQIAVTWWLIFKLGEIV